MSESGNERASKVVTDVYKSIYALECYCCGSGCLYIRVEEVEEKELRGCLGFAEILVITLENNVEAKRQEARAATVTRPEIPSTAALLRGHVRGDLFYYH